MAEATVKGFIIAKSLDLARGALDPAGFEALEAELGVRFKDLKNAFFKDFPVRLQMAVEEKVCEVVWGEPYRKAVYKIGRLNFESFRESAIGRTTLAFLGSDPRKIVLATVKLASKVVNGIEIEVAERGADSFVIRFGNCPHLAEGWQGTVDAALEYAGVLPNVTISGRGHNSFELTVAWSA